MLDMPCAVLVAATLHASVAAQAASVRAGPTGPSASYLLWLTAGGILLGLAMSAKFAMALPTLAWVGLHNLHTLLHHCAAADAPGSLWSPATLLLDAGLRGLLLLGGAAAVYILQFAVYFNAVPLTQWKSSFNQVSNRKIAAQLRRHATPLYPHLILGKSRIRIRIQRGETARSTLGIPTWR